MIVIPSISLLMIYIVLFPISLHELFECISFVYVPGMLIKYVRAHIEMIVIPSISLLMIYIVLFPISLHELFECISLVFVPGCIHNTCQH